MTSFKKFFILISVLSIFILRMYPVSATETSPDVNDEDFEAILDAIVETEMKDNSSMIVHGRYLITCEEDSTTGSARTPVYSITKSKTHTITDLSTNTKVFKLTQSATAIFNSITGKVAISSHKVTFTGINSLFTYVSQKNLTNLNVYNTTLIGSDVQVTVKKINTTYDLIAHVAVYYDTQNFTFSLSKTW